MEEQVGILRQMTFGEAARLNPKDQAGELDSGRWIPATKNTWRHGVIVGNAYALLREYARRNPGWSVSVGDPGTKLGHGPDILRGPDVAMVRAERMPKGSGVDGWLEGALERRTTFLASLVSNSRTSQTTEDIGNSSERHSNLAHVASYRGRAIMSNAVVSNSEPDGFLGNSVPQVANTWWLHVNRGAR